MNILIIGFGGYGEALVGHFSNLQRFKVFCLSRTFSDRMNAYPDVVFFTAKELNDQKFDFVFIAIPSSSLVDFFTNCKKFFFSSSVIISCCKGMCRDSNLFASEIIKNFISNDKVLVLSGPSFSSDIQASRQIVVSLAGDDLMLTSHVAEILSSNKFKLVPAQSRFQLEFAGVFKNIIAIGSGIISGLNMGSSFQAAFVAHGMFEFQRLCRLLGSDLNIINSVGIVGDFVLTCTSSISRNYNYGVSLVTGQVMSKSLTVEGINSINSLTLFLNSKGVNSEFVDFLILTFNNPSLMLDFKVSD
jgi:glycerol-3-phosphate dehydrogenase